MKDPEDQRRQVAHHALPLALVTLAAVGVVAGGIALARSRRRRRQNTLGRFSGLLEAIRRMSAHPERVALPTPGAGRRIATTGATAAMSFIARRLAARLFDL